MIFLAIDLQPDFTASKKQSVIKAAQEEIKRAIRFNYGIVFLEYKLRLSAHKPTLPEIKSLANGYANQITVLKNDDDGGHEVIDAIAKHKLNMNKVRVCGVNTDMCVHDTVRTISSLSPNSEIIIRKDGCNSSRQNDFDRFLKYKNVRVIDGE